MKGLFLDDKTMRKETQKILDSLGIKIDPTIRVRELSMFKLFNIFLVHSIKDISIKILCKTHYKIS